MNKILAALSISTIIATIPCHASFKLGDAVSTAETKNLSTLATGLINKVNTQSSSPIVSRLTHSLNVSSAQATGGAGSLLSYASSTLTGKQAEELTSLLPSMNSLTSSLPGLSNTSTNMTGVSNIFNQLGMNTSNVSQFSPIIIKYLSGQGASSELISSLTSLWK